MQIIIVMRENWMTLRLSSAEIDYYYYYYWVHSYEPSVVFQIFSNKKTAHAVSNQAAMNSRQQFCFQLNSWNCTAVCLNCSIIFGDPVIFLLIYVRSCKNYGGRMNFSFFKIIIIIKGEKRINPLMRICKARRSSRPEFSCFILENSETQHDKLCWLYKNIYLFSVCCYPSARSDRELIRPNPHSGQPPTQQRAHPTHHQISISLIPTTNFCYFCCCLAIIKRIITIIGVWMAVTSLLVPAA